jgi:IclR family mhp operon transcriptional activator
VAQLLAKVRTDGFGMREGRFFPHTKSIAVPVMRDGAVAACLTVIWISSALSMAEGIRSFLAPLKRCAGRIEEAMPASG